MSSHWSLVAFTLLIQFAAGIVWFMQVASICHPGPLSGGYLLYPVFTALGAALAGLTAAMGHLGRPWAGFHAIRNIRGSWLSRESATVSVFIGVLVIMAVVSLIRPGSLIDYVLPVASLAAGAALCSMVFVYRLRTVPTWNHAGTPLNYLSSAFLLGGLLFILVSVNHPQVFNSGFAGPVNHLYRNIGLFAIVAGYIIKIAAFIITPPADLDVVKGLRISATIAQVLGGVALLALLGLTEVSSNLQPVFLLLMIAGVVTGEIIHRIRFYEVYYRVGL